MQYAGDMLYNVIIEFVNVSALKGQVMVYAGDGRIQTTEKTG